MQYIEVPEFPRLRGEEAIEALYGFVDEVEEQRGKELTDKQTNALIKFVWGLISSIETEMRSSSSNKDVKERRFVSKLKGRIMKYVPESFRIQKEGRLWK